MIMFAKKKKKGEMCANLYVNIYDPTSCPGETDASNSFVVVAYLYSVY